MKAMNQKETANNNYMLTTAFIVITFGVLFIPFGSYFTSIPAGIGLIVQVFQSLELLVLLVSGTRHKAFDIRLLDKYYNCQFFT